MSPILSDHSLANRTVATVFVTDEEEFETESMAVLANARREGVPVA
jgi:hypothetical protein